MLLHTYHGHARKTSDPRYKPGMRNKFEDTNRHLIKGNEIQKLTLKYERKFIFQKISILDLICHIFPSIVLPFQPRHTLLCLSIRIYPNLQTEKCKNFVAQM